MSNTIFGSTWDQIYLNDIENQFTQNSAVDVIQTSQIQSNTQELDNHIANDSDHSIVNLLFPTNPTTNRELYYLALNKTFQRIPINHILPQDPTLVNKHMYIYDISVNQWINRLFNYTDISNLANFLTYIHTNTKLSQLNDAILPGDQYKLTKLNTKEVCIYDIQTPGSKIITLQNENIGANYNMILPNSINAEQNAFIVVNNVTGPNVNLTYARNLLELTLINNTNNLFQRILSNPTQLGDESYELFLPYYNSTVHTNSTETQTQYIPRLSLIETSQGQTDAKLHLSWELPLISPLYIKPTLQDKQLFGVGNVIPDNWLLVYSQSGNYYYPAVNTINRMINFNVNTSTPASGSVIQWDGQNYRDAPLGISDISTLATQLDSKLNKSSFDVRITTPTNYHILYYDTNDSKWFNSNEQYINVNDLKNMQVLNLQQNDILQWKEINPGNFRWVNTQFNNLYSIHEASDVTLGGVTLANGQVLVYQNGQWINQEQSIVFTNVDYKSLKDINTDLASGDFLIWDILQDKFLPIKPELDTLNDCSVTLPVNKQILYYNNGEWANQNHNMELMNNVILTGIQDGQVLKYLSGNWVNQNDTQQDLTNYALKSFVILNTDNTTITPEQNKHVLMWNGVDKWVNKLIAITDVTNLQANLDTKISNTIYNDFETFLNNFTNDVLIGTANNGDVIKYDSTTSKWINQPDTAADLSNYALKTYVTINSDNYFQQNPLQNGDIIQYAGGGSPEFRNYGMGGLLNVVAPTEKHVLRYSIAGDWQNSQLVLNDIVQVNVQTTPLQNQILTYVGTDWINQDPQYSTLGDLNDTNINTAVTNYQSLRYENGQWHNKQLRLQDFNIRDINSLVDVNGQPSIQNGSYLYYNSSEDKFICEPLTFPSYSLNGLSDVQNTTPTVNQILLSYDNLGQIFYHNVDNTLNNMKDMTISGLVEGYRLQSYETAPSSGIYKWLNVVDNITNCVDYDNSNPPTNNQVIMWDTGLNPPRWKPSSLSSTTSFDLVNNLAASQRIVTPSGQINLEPNNNVVNLVTGADTAFPSYVITNSVAQTLFFQQHKSLYFFYIAVNDTSGTFLPIQSYQAFSNPADVLINNLYYVSSTQVSSKTKKFSIRPKIDDKNDIVDRLLKLNVCTFGFYDKQHSDDSKETPLKIGLIVEEIQKLFPRYVQNYQQETFDTQTKSLNKNKKNNDISDCGISYDSLICYLILGFQTFVKQQQKNYHEMYGVINKQQTEINDLKQVIQTQNNSIKNILAKQKKFDNIIKIFEQNNEELQVQ